MARARRWRHHPVDDLAFARQTHVLASQSFNVAVVRLQALDVFAEVLIVLLQQKGGVLLLALLVMQTQHMDQPVITPDGGNHEQHQPQNTSSQRAFVFRGWWR